MTNDQPTNDEVADLLEQIADLLEIQDANPHRVRAYRSGAQTIREQSDSVARLLLERGRGALEELPAIGKGLAQIISEFVHTGQSNQQQRLRGELSPEALFTRVPGIGEELAERIVTQLNIDTLEELERAAHDGRLQSVEGFGSRRVDAVRHSLAGMLSRSALRRSRRAAEKGQQPSVALLLELDADYRRRAAAGELKRIAPRRFNPNNEAWLPIMHAERDGWSFTLLYSNTALAHQLGTTDDWVVIYYERDGREQQNTVVTETQGPLKGRRVVRGREDETRRYYA